MSLSTHSTRSAQQQHQRQQQQDNSVAVPCKQFTPVNPYDAREIEDDAWLAFEIHIGQTMAMLTRLSFEDVHRQPISELGGIKALAELIQVRINYNFARKRKLTHDIFFQIERSTHGDRARGSSSGGPCSEVRRFAVVALTNLTFGNSSIKSFLCTSPAFVGVMVRQLEEDEALRKATAHLFRNLAWKPCKPSKQILRDSKVVAVLVLTAMEVARKGLRAPSVASFSSSGDEAQAGQDGGHEGTLKVILSALWNLSAHCGKNKVSRNFPKCERS